MEANQRHPTGLEIAVIGLAGRFPGASGWREFWQFLLRGGEAHGVFSDAEVSAAGAPPELIDDPHYVKAGPVLEDIELFDAEFFAMTPREAQITDPQQRWFLECAWEALEDAACDPTTWDGRIGVYAGASTNDYQQLVLSSLDARLVGPLALVGNAPDFLATRVTYKLDLLGPGLTVQTACSSSLVAVHLACQALLSGTCDLVLAGGAAIRVPQRLGYLYQPGGALSPDGRCRPFDDGARGTMRGSGVGIVVLKRLEEALEEGDNIRAVIRGSAINNDGAAKVGFTAPSVPGQERVLRTALAMAEVDPDTIGYIEAHGTATELGDSIEVEALNRVFGESGGRREPCLLGSVKSNIGHLDAAAGVTSLIKTVLALEQGRIPASLHFQTPNRQIDFERVPFRVPTRTTPWEADHGPRRAGVSAFGIGGTNAHVVLEEAPPKPPVDPSRPWQLLMLSARSEAALEAVAHRLAEHLEKELEAGEEISLADLAFTLSVGRRALPHRRILPCRDLRGAIEGLRQSPPRAWRSVATASPDGIVFLFPGQGRRRQLLGMGRELYEQEPIFRQHLDRCAELLRPHLDQDLRLLLYPPAGELERAQRQLQRLELIQPLLFAVEYALAQVWLAWGIRPRALVGHSLGEWVAATLGGVLALEDALGLVAVRGRLILETPPGVMTAVSLDAASLEPRLSPPLALAASNAPDRSVVSGPEAAMVELEARLASEGISCTRLDTARAAHSSLMEPAAAGFVPEVRRRALKPPRLPVISCVSGRPLTPEEATDPEYWGRHLTQTVRFAEAIDGLLEGSSPSFLEIGPRTLCDLVRRHTPAPAVAWSLPTSPGEASEWPHLLSCLGRLWLSGVEIDRGCLFRDQRRRRLSLPTYPFERVRYWIDRPEGEPAPSPGQLPPEPASTVLRVPSFRQVALPTPIPEATDRPGPAAPWLLLADGPVAEELARHLRRNGCEVVVAADRNQALAALESFTAAGGEALRIVQMELGEIGDGEVRRLLALVHGAARVAPGTPIHWTLVGRGLCAVLGGDASPWGSLLSGLLEGIHLELPQIGCSVLDVAGHQEPLETPATLAGLLLAELLAPAAAASRVAYRGRHRWLRLAEPPAAVPAAGADRAGRCVLFGGRQAQVLELAARLRDDPSRRVLVVDPEGEIRSSATARRATLPVLEAAFLDRLAGREQELWRQQERLELATLPGFVETARRLCAAYVLAYFRAAGLELRRLEPRPEAEIRERLRILPKFHKFLDYMLELLVAEGWARRERGALTPTVDPAAEDPERLLAEVVERYPDFRDLFTMVGHCVRNYPRALSGEIPAIGVMYPDGSYDRTRKQMQITKRYGTDEVYLHLLEEALAGLADLPLGRPLRILEVGAGNGLLTDGVSAALRGRRVHYHFTDLGRSFVQKASRRSSEFGFERIDFSTFDISRHPAIQGLDVGSYDLVLAYNVIHATPRLDLSLAHLEAMLASGGVLAIVESLRTYPWEILVVGLAEGWWYFEDTYRQTSPLVPIPCWQERISRLGFERIWAVPVDPQAQSTAHSCLLLAQKAGTPATSEGTLSPTAGGGRSLDAPAAPSVAATLQRIRAEWGGIDTLIHALTVPPLGLLETPEEPWMEALEASLRELGELSQPLRSAQPSRLLTLALVAGDGGDSHRGRALQSALAAWLEATSDPRGGETTVSVEGPVDEGFGLRELLDLPPGLAAASYRAAIGRAGASAPEDSAAGQESLTGAAQEGSAAAEEPEQQALIQILKDLVGLERIDRSCTFLEIGGDSLLALQVLSRVRDELGLELKVEDLLGERTIGEWVGQVGRSAPRSAPPAGEPQPWAGRLPLLPTQSWFLERSTDRSDRSNVPLFLEVDKGLNQAALRQAVAALYRRHDALRSRIAGRSNGRHQVVEPPQGEIPIHAVDLSGLQPCHRPSRLCELASRGLERLDPYRGPVQRLVWFGLGGTGGDRLLIGTHHIIIDGRSLQIFCEDLWTAHGQAAAGIPLRLPPPTDSLASWVAGLERYLQSPRVRDQVRYWVEQPWQEAAEIPLDEVRGPNSLGSSQELTLELGERLAEAMLRELPQRHGVDIQDILLTGLVAALAWWTGERCQLVHVVRHGRDPLVDGVDVSRTFGWFSTAGHPILLGWRGDPMRSLRSIAERLRSVPDHGQGFDILRYSSPDPEIRGMMRKVPPPRVLFNYVGRYADPAAGDSSVRIAPEPLRPAVDPDRDRTVLLKVAAGVLESHRLRLSLGYSENLHRRSTIEAFGERYLHFLEQLIERGG